MPGVDDSVRLSASRAGCESYLGSNPNPGVASEANRAGVGATNGSESVPIPAF